MANKVLIVDDSENMLDLLTIYLSELDLDVIRTNLPMEAYHLIQKELPDLIICDMIMPEMEGTRLFEMVRENKSIPFIPFMLMTAFDHRDIEKFCYSYGIDEFILKPIDKNLLHQRVKKILSLTKDYRASSKGESLIYGQINETMDNAFINHLYNSLMVGKTGFFEVVQDDQSKSFIWIVDGDLKNAKVGDDFGKDALQKILGLSAGEYVFIEGDFGMVEHKIKESSMDLILHLCQNIDEQNIA